MCKSNVSVPPFVHGNCRALDRKYFHLEQACETIYLRETLPSKRVATKAKYVNTQEALNNIILHISSITPVIRRISGDCKGFIWSI
jgi:hypothetical protein